MSFSQLFPSHLHRQQPCHGDVNEALRAFLQPHVLKRSTLDQFLDSKAQVWAKFDRELGYLLRNAFVRDGVDGCHTLARYQKSGQRQQVNFPDQPCRMNTYGDSFTQGHQVSDGETWQEIFAAAPPRDPSLFATL